MIALLGAAGADRGEYHWTWFTPLYRALEDRLAGTPFVRHHPAFGHIGQTWFEAICFLYLTAAALALVTWLATRRLQRFPHGLQNLAELTVEAMRSLTVGIIGPHGEKFTPYIGTLFVFILLLNLWGVVPGGLPPSATLSSTLALGVATFVYVHAVSIREIGLRAYLAHLANWLPTRRTAYKLLQLCLLTPVIFFSHLLGELIRPITLSFRLFANMFGKEKVITGILTQDAGIAIGFFPVFFILLLLGVVVSVVQAFLFATLSAVYISLFTAHAEEHSENSSHEPTQVLLGRDRT